MRSKPSSSRLTICAFDHRLTKVCPDGHSVRPCVLQSDSLMRFARVALLLLLVSAAIAGCRKPNSDLGLGLQPDGELLDLRTDTLTFSIEMVPVDSLRTDERSRLLLGNTIDPVSGLTSAFFSTELRLSQTNKDFGTNPICDSVIFTLRFNGPSYGFNFDQMLRVEQLTDTISIDSAYYSQDIPLTIPINLATPSGQPVQMHPFDSVFVGSEGLSARVRIPLSTSFGQGLIDADTSVYASNDAWRSWFKGLQVRSESGGGGIVSLEPNAGTSYLTLHYHNTTDTTSYNFIINSNAARIGHFGHSWPPEFGALNDSLPTENAPRVALLGAAGSYLRLDLSGLDSLDVENGTVINRAEVVLPLEDVPSKLPRPAGLTAFMKGLNGGLEFTPEVASPGVTFGGAYDPAQNAYVINLPIYAQRRLNGEETRPHVYLYSELSSVALEQVVFRTPESTAEAALIVTRSE